MAHNLLGIDFGAKRVGLAVALAGAAPQRLETLANTPTLFEVLRQRIATHHITLVVLGLPRNLDGDDTAQTTLARAFGVRLRELHPQLELVWQDEALTSELARERLQHQKVRAIPALLDQEAAVIILEDYQRES